MTGYPWLPPQSSSKLSTFQQQVDIKNCRFLSATTSHRHVYVCCLGISNLCAAGCYWAITENWVTTGWQQFLKCSHCPTRLNSTQLVLNMFRTPRLAKNWRFSVELSWVELSWVELSLVGQCERGLKHLKNTQTNRHHYFIKHIYIVSEWYRFLMQVSSIFRQLEKMTTITQKHGIKHVKA